MKEFFYKARSAAGEPVTGVLEGISDSVVAQTLKDHGLFVVSISEKRNLSLKGLLARVNPVSQRDVANFTRLLSTMLSSGLPMTESLTNLGVQYTGGPFREVIQAVLRDVQSGSSLSESLKRHPLVFDNLYINLVKAGEASGKLDDALLKLADTLDSTLAFKSKVSGALVYPGIVLTAMVAISIFMIVVIIPQISSVYKQFGSDLPLPTRILIFISDLLVHSSWVVLLFGGVVYFFYRAVKNNPAGELLLNNLQFKLPIIGRLNQETTYVIITRVLATLLSSGVGVVESLQIVEGTMANNYFRQGLANFVRAVEKGTALSMAVRRDPNFPLMMSQLMSIGEETGTLDQSLIRLSLFYQDLVERRVATLTTALEPLMILLMGTMVGGLAIAVLLPLFNLSNVIH